MGLFSAFGVGGGKLSLQLQASTVQAGGVVAGAAVFTGGKRPQKITTIKVRVSCTTYTQKMGPQGVETQSHSTDIVPAVTVCGALATQPQQVYQYPFQLQMPPTAYSSAPNLVVYQVNASADIDGEIDPGAHAELTVFGIPYAPPQQPGMMQPGMMQPGMMQPGMMQPGMMQPGMMQPGMMQPGMMQPGMMQPGMMQPGMMQPGMMDPKQQMMDPKQQMMAKPGMPQPGMLQPGMHCQAQWTDGAFYGATVVQTDGVNFLVQWDDGTAPMWLRADQVMPG